MLDLLFLILAACGGCAIGSRIVRRQCARANDAALEHMAVKCAAAVTAAMREAYEAGVADQEDGIADVERYAAMVHVWGLKSVDKVMETENV